MKALGEDEVGAPTQAPFEMNISTSIRNESYQAIRPDLGARQRAVLAVFEANPSGMTAWEVFEHLRKFDAYNGWAIYTVRPRITEMVIAGRLKECGTRWHGGTKRTETVFCVRKQFEFDDNGQASFI